MSDLRELIMVLCLCGFVFYLTYRITQFISKRAMGKASCRNLHIIEQVKIGKDQRIAVLKVGEGYYMAGITSEQIQFEKLDNEIIIQGEPMQEWPVAGKVMDFKAVLTSMKEKDTHG